MCGIVGYINSNRKTLEGIFKQNNNRGYDGYGYGFLRNGNMVVNKSNSVGSENYKVVSASVLYESFGMVNFRAQPLPEVESSNNMSLQPVVERGTNNKDRVFLVHNGTISNDYMLKEKYGFDDYKLDSQVIAKMYLMFMDATNNNIRESIERTCASLEGGFAVILYDHYMHKLVVFKNYKTLNIKYRKEKELIVCSEIDKNSYYDFVTFPAYTAAIFDPKTISMVEQFSITSKHGSKYIPRPKKTNIVTVCSGGMDSSLAAFIANKIVGFENNTIMNINLNQRGWLGEKTSAEYVAQKLGAKFIHLDARPVFKNFIKTPLTSYDLYVEQGLRSAEAGTEWVPARNTILLSMGAGIAESNGAQYLCFGGNLEEESSCYSDNDLEFAKFFSETMQRGTVYGVKMLNLISRLMKKDIVTLGTALDVPLDRTLSCYNPVDIYSLQGDEDKQHIVEEAKKKNMVFVPCGTCGCCSIRRHAFLAARIQDPQENLYVNPMVDKFPTYDRFIERIEKHGYIDTNREWKDKIIESYKERIMSSHGL